MKEETPKKIEGKIAKKLSMRLDEMERCVRGCLSEECIKRIQDDVKSLFMDESDEIDEGEEGDDELEK